MAVTIKTSINLTEMGINEVPKSDRAEVKEQVAEFLLESVLDHVANQTSPVDGSGFAPLSKEYLPLKKKKTGSSSANLELTGGMLDDLETKITGNQLEIGLFKKTASESSLLKAENHNKFTSRSLKSKVPKRAFIPKEGTYSSEIMTAIEEIIADAAVTDEAPKQEAPKKKRGPNIKKKPWDESTKDTPEYDIRKAQRKEAELREKLQVAKEKLEDLNDKESKAKSLERQRDNARALIDEANEKIANSKKKIKLLKEKLNRTKRK